MAKPDKTNKQSAAPAKAKHNGPEARLPRGFRDIEAAEIRGLQAMLAKIREVYERYGFEPLETPTFEYTDALGKFLPDQDRPNAGVFSLLDEDEHSERGLPSGASNNSERGLPSGASNNSERGLPGGASNNSERGLPGGASKNWMSLRYDLTAPLARYVAENFDKLPKPFRRYATGIVYRNEKPGPGRFRQFTQFDADTVGAESVAADAEICMLAADTLEALGIARGDYRIKINNRKLLDGMLATVGIDIANEGQRLAVLRSLDKMDKFTRADVALLLGPGRKDESGDFTKGAGLDVKQSEALLDFVSDPALARADAGAIAARTGFQPTELFVTGLAELAEIERLVRAAGYGEDRIRIDYSVVRGLDYYTGPVFEAELTFEVKDDDGRPVRFGSVGGGGRYDDLVARFTGQKVPATGFSIGVSRLQAALLHIGKAAEPTLGPVVVLVMDKDQLAAYQAMTQELRAAGIRAEMYLGSSGMKAQMKYADKRSSPVVVIQGSDERAKGEVTLKDLIEGAQAAAAIKDNKEWKEARPAQVTVNAADLVAEVKKILARHT